MKHMWYIIGKLTKMWHQKGMKMKNLLLFILCLISTLVDAKLFVGKDQSQFRNPFIQPQDPAQSGGNRDQTLQYGDILVGTARSDIMIGGLGPDIIFGEGGDDLIIGGGEGSNPFSRDRIFAGEGDDIVVWSPGDGTDFLDFGRGADTLVIGILAIQDGDTLSFPLNNSQRFVFPFLDNVTGLPLVDALNSTGFCEILDDSDSKETAEGLATLEVDQVIRFVIRDIRNDFERGVQIVDNGLRVSLHIKNLEFLVCANRNGKALEYIDLQTNPPKVKPISSAPLKIQQMLRSLKPTV